MYLLREYGLRPLAVTFDNTWGTDISVQNIQNMTNKLDIDLYTYVVDAEEFDDISRSFLLASVPDADIPNDIAIAKLYYIMMDKFNIDISICGHSFRTEGTVPLGWTYMDGKYIESVHNMFGSVPRKTFLNLELNYWIKHISKNRFRMLYYIQYNKHDAVNFLQDNFSWRWYGAHHHENEYTKFIKSYLLPQKFNIDKRYVEFSALVRSGQKNRDQAIEELSHLPDVQCDFVKYVIGRLGFSQDEFDDIMQLPIKSHYDYQTYHQYFKDNKKKFKELLDKDMISLTFYEKYTN